MSSSRGPLPLSTKEQLFFAEKRIVELEEENRQLKEANVGYYESVQELRKLVPASRPTKATKRNKSRQRVSAWRQKNASPTYMTNPGITPPSQHLNGAQFHTNLKDFLTEHCEGFSCGIPSFDTPDNLLLSEFLEALKSVEGSATSAVKNTLSIITIAAEFLLDWLLKKKLSHVVVKRRRRAYLVLRIFGATEIFTRQYTITRLDNISGSASAYLAQLYSSWFPTFLLNSEFTGLKHSTKFKFDLPPLASSSNYGQPAASSSSSSKRRGPVVTRHRERRLLQSELPFAGDDDFSV